MAETAFGTRIVGSSSGTIGMIKSISGGGQSLSAVETSNMDVDTVINLIGLIRGKPITFEVEYDDADVGGGTSYSAYANDTEYNVGDHVTYGGSVWLCKAYLANSSVATVPGVGADSGDYWTYGSNHAKIQAACEGRAAQTWTITFADTSTITGSGTVSDYTSPEGETESELTFTFEITPATVWVHTGA